MKIQASSNEPSLYSDPFQVSPSKSSHQHRRVVAQPSKVQEEAMRPLQQRVCPVSTRAYNRKDYEYIASFSQAGMKANRSKAELLQHQDILNKHIDDDVAATYTQLSEESRASLPEFGAWNVEPSSPAGEGYTNVFDRAREQKRGLNFPAQSVPLHLQSPVKDLAVANEIPRHAGTHHRKWSPSSWSCCCVAPLTINELGGVKKDRTTQFEQAKQRR